MNATLETPAPVFDAREMRERFAGYPKVLDGAIALFLKLTPGRIEQLGAALAAADVDAACAHAHAIKGSSANVGGEEFAGVAGRIEKLLRTRSLEAAREQWPCVGAAWERLRRELSVFTTAPAA